MKKHLNELQAYSGIAILFVTLIHANGYYMLNVLKLNSYIDAGIFFNLIDKIVHVAVPMFIFIAGYKYALNNIYDDYKTYAIKKIKSVFKPFITISVIYYIINIIKNPEYYNNIKSIVIDFINIFMGYSAAYQLWYIPMFLLLILTYPFFYKYIRDSKLRLSLFIFLLITWKVVVGNIHIPYISTILNSHTLSFVQYLYLYEIGSLFYLKKLHLKDGKKVILLYMIILLISSLIKNDTYSSIFAKYILNPVSVMAFYYISIRIKSNKLLLTLGKYSFYIYLFHEPYFISETSSFIQIHGLYKSGLIAPIVSVLSIILSIFIYKVLEKLYIARYLFGIKNKDANMQANP